MSDLSSLLAPIRAREAAATEGPWEESWVDIPGYDGYQVSDFGNVRSFFKKGNHNTKRAQEARTLKLVDNRGYRTVSLPSGGKYGHRTVHRLVMLAFGGPCPEGQEVAHLNGNPSDNRRVNLAYVSHVENEAHKVEHGTNGLGERNAVAILQGWQVAEIKFLAAKSVPQGKIAALFDISHKAVSEILNGVRWAHEPARTDIPRLLGALDAVLAIHEPVDALMNPGRHERVVKVCTGCGTDDGNWQRYPCPTVTAVTAALGEQA